MRELGTDTRTGDARTRGPGAGARATHAGGGGSLWARGSPLSGNHTSCWGQVGGTAPVAGLGAPPSPGAAAGSWRGHTLGGRWSQPSAFSGADLDTLGVCSHPTWPLCCRALTRLRVRAWPVGRAAPGGQFPCPQPTSPPPGSGVRHVLRFVPFGALGWSAALSSLLPGPQASARCPQHPTPGRGTSRGSGLGTRGVPAASWADPCAPQHPATGAPLRVTERSQEKGVAGVTYRGRRPAVSLGTAPRLAQAAPGSALGSSLGYSCRGFGTQIP